MRLFSMVFAWLFSWGEPEEKNQPEIEPSYLGTDTDTAGPSDTAEPLDTAEETEETGTSETGEAGDTADSGDTATTTDTALKSAMELAGENGCFGCATVSSDAAASILLGVLALGLRRRED